MKLSRTDVNSAYRAIEQEDARNLKKGTDIYLSGGRLIGNSPDGTKFYLTFNNDGTVEGTIL